jgi:hypothetical protein
MAILPTLLLIVLLIVGISTQYPNAFPATTGEAATPQVPAFKN